MEDKELQLYLDIFQDIINITCILLMWVYFSKLLAVPVILLEFVRIGSYFNLGEKAKQNVEKTYADYLSGDISFKKKK
jgi:hypothetical protein